MSKHRAVPLCLPNNCKWEELTGKYNVDGEERKRLCVIEAALRKLRNVKGNYLNFTVINMELGDAEVTAR